MKSILFTVLKKKLLSGEKTQTFRLTYIPTYIVHDIVKIDFKETLKKTPHRSTLFLAKVLKLYPKQVKDLTLEEAKLDGFNSVKEFIDKLMELHRVSKKNKERFLYHWGFITLFERVKDVLDYSEENNENK